MIQLHITDLSGTERTITVAPSGSLMEAIRDNGFPDLLAACGGCCSCATCHVALAPSDIVLAPASDEEDELLDASDERSSGSRLACQLSLMPARDGLKVRIVEAV